jgi:hypothetical protein
LCSLAHYLHVSLDSRGRGPGCAHFPIVPLLMHCDSLLVDHFLPLGDQHIALLSESAGLVCYELLGVTFLSA